MDRNIILLFRNGRVNKAPFFRSTGDYKTDTLIGYNETEQNFDLFYILNDYKRGNFELKANNKGLDLDTDPKIILETFHRELKNGTAKKNIKIIDQFSKSFPAVDQHQPIFLKEASAILNALDAFKIYIKSSPLTLICSDSRVSYFLFSKKVQDSTKKFIRWALKLQLDYPEVRIVNISGANNIADYLSRIGVSKATWFGTSLYPLMIDKEERKKLPDILTWNDLIKYCDQSIG